MDSTHHDMVLEFLQTTLVRSFHLAQRFIDEQVLCFWLARRASRLCLRIFCCVKRRECQSGIFNPLIFHLKRRLGLFLVKAYMWHSAGHRLDPVTSVKRNVIQIFLLFRLEGKILILNYFCFFLAWSTDKSFVLVVGHFKFLNLLCDRLIFTNHEKVKRKNVPVDKFKLRGIKSNSRPNLSIFALSLNLHSKNNCRVAAVTDFSDVFKSE